MVKSEIAKAKATARELNKMFQEAKSSSNTRMLNTLNAYRVQLQSMGGKYHPVGGKRNFINLSSIRSKSMAESLNKGSLQAVYESVRVVRRTEKSFETFRKNHGYDRETWEKFTDIVSSDNLKELIALNRMNSTQIINLINQSGDANKVEQVINDFMMKIEDESSNLRNMSSKRLYHYFSKELEKENPFI